MKRIFPTLVAALFLVAIIDLGRPGFAARMAHLVSRVLENIVLMLWILLNRIFSVLVYHVGDTGAGLVIILLAAWFIWRGVKK
jgi:hypothetical protein